MRLYCLLLASENGIVTSRLNSYMYILQRLNFKLDYSFRLNTSGVCSKIFSRYLEEQVATGFLEQKRGIISPTRESSLALSNMILSFDEIENSTKVITVLNSLSDDMLHLVCITDIIIQNVIKTMGLNELVAQRDFIESSIENLCSAYSKDNFNLAVSIIESLKKECSLDV